MKGNEPKESFMSKWLRDAVFYEIYPQSFKDTNNDGIGDINGIIEKLDYINGLGCNAIWINPCFDSPFKDAGYDVRDYKKVASRYGCNNDLYRLFGEAHKKGMHVLLDLVPGHTSEEHLWFRQSQKDEKNEFTNRYIWTDFCFQGSESDLPYIGGESERSATYILNFFKCQPALNYGFLKPDKDWQLPIDHPDCLATREAIKDVMRFWLDHGCDGFRVDMAASLVKHDDEMKSGTTVVWKDILAMLRHDYPEAAMVSEWSNPKLALRAGFDMDFYLDDSGSGYRSLLRDYKNYKTNKDAVDNSFFRKDGEGDIRRFLNQYLDDYNDTKSIGYISMITCNHDTERPAYHLSQDELKIAYAFIFTMPGVPFLYYGDEIGMRYHKLPSFEGGYFRTGSRTPMQWDNTENVGFSKGCADSLYLPVDGSLDAPNVAAEENDKDSLLNTVRRILRFRHDHLSLQADADIEFIYAEAHELPVIYRRGEFVIAVNPSQDRQSVNMDIDQSNVVFQIGNGSNVNGVITLDPQSFVVFG